MLEGFGGIPDLQLAKSITAKQMKEVSTVQQAMDSAAFEYDGLMARLGRETGEKIIVESNKASDGCLALAVRWGLSTLLPRAEEPASLEKLRSLWAKHSAPADVERLSISDELVDRVTKALSSFKEPVQKASRPRGHKKKGAPAEEEDEAEEEAPPARGRGGRGRGATSRGRAAASAVASQAEEPPAAPAKKKPKRGAA